MSKLKNWIVPIIFFLGAFFDQYYGLVITLVKKLELPSYWELIIQLFVGAIALVIVKLQPPSLKKAKQAKEGHHIKA
jgi:predicted oxidoreductase (fatty acid repression mutant protein)